MLFVYLGSVLFGGALVAVSTFSGDSDVDGEIDADADADADADGDGDDGDRGVSGVDTLAWLPFGSMRFWTFFLAFGGLTGTLLSLLDTSAILTGGLSAGVGYVSGLGITRVVSSLKKARVSSGIDEGDYIGSSATVLLPVRAGAPGQVQLELRGRIVARAADTDDVLELGIGHEVFIRGVSDEGLLLVTGDDPTQ